MPILERIALNFESNWNLQPEFPEEDWRSEEETQAWIPILDVTQHKPCFSYEQRKTRSSIWHGCENQMLKYISDEHSI
jgi:hypothetical protein